jgi:hypothetical protein
VAAATLAFLTLPGWTVTVLDVKVGAKPSCWALASG